MIRKRLHELSWRQPATASDGRPYTVIGYLNGVGSVPVETGNNFSGSRFWSPAP